jgi:hypothetical protein
MIAGDVCAPAFALNGVREPDTIGPIELLYSSRASIVMPVSYFGWR